MEFTGNNHLTARYLRVSGGDPHNERQYLAKKSDDDKKDDKE